MMRRLRSVKMESMFDWAGCFLGVAGSYLLALDNSASKYGWAAYFLANIFYIALAKMIGRPGLLWQQMFFVGSSTLGLYNSFVVPSMAVIVPTLDVVP